MARNKPNKGEEFPYRVQFREELRRIFEPLDFSSFPAERMHELGLKYSVDRPPARIEKRVFIGGNYILMPILREIERIVTEMGFQPIIAFDFDIPREKTREYTLRLLFQCKFAIFEETLGGGQAVEVVRASGFQEIKYVQVFMAMDETKTPPYTASGMIWQTQPPPQGYLTIEELSNIVKGFLSEANGKTGH